MLADGLRRRGRRGRIAGSGRRGLISDNNIKVKDDRTGKELSFLLVPHFDRVFSGDGKSTYQMKALHSGQLVKVFFDQKFFGQRHADRILVLTRHEMAVKQQKG